MSSFVEGRPGGGVPVTYQIDSAARFIHTRCIGAVVLEEVREHFATLSRDPECPARLDVLLDLREMTTIPGTSELRTVTTDIARIRPQVRFGSCAIIASRDVLFGMARMFEVFAEEYFAATRVFRGEVDGLAWLESRRREPSGEGAADRHRPGG